MGWLILATVVVSLAEYRLVKWNIGYTCNGYGAIDGTWYRKGDAPMRYRVLVPWLVGWIPHGDGRLVAYLTAKAALLFVALLASSSLLSPVGIVALIVAVCLCIQYDYWSDYAELAGLALCLSGEPWKVAVGAVLWGLSRETVLLAPLFAFCAGGWVAGAVGLAGPVVSVVVRLVQGKATMYCARWTLKVYNAADLRQMWKKKDSGPLQSIAVCLTFLAAVLFLRGRMGAALADTAWIAPAWLFAGWLLARARETRVFLPLALWIAGAIC